MQILKASQQDIAEIYNLIKEYSEKEILLPRSKATIEKELPLTWVAKINNTLVAVGNLISFDTKLYEVRGLVVNDKYRSQKLGFQIVQKMIEFLKSKNDYRSISLFALTYVPKFFQSCSFEIVTKEKFPAKIYEVCQFCSKQNDCKEIAVELNWSSYNKMQHHRLEEGQVLNLDFSKIKNITSNVIPAIAQDYQSKEVLIVGYVDQQALDHSINNKVATFYSTSRNELWVKGATSGNTLQLHEIRVNCEQNSILYLVEPLGSGSCHTKNKEGVFRDSCYYRKIDFSDKNKSLDFI